MIDLVGLWFVLTWLLLSGPAQAAATQIAPLVSGLTSSVGAWLGMQWLSILTATAWPLQKLQAVGAVVSGHANWLVCKLQAVGATVGAQATVMPPQKQAAVGAAVLLGAVMMTVTEARKQVRHEIGVRGACSFHPPPSTLHPPPSTLHIPHSTIRFQTSTILRPPSSFFPPSFLLRPPLRKPAWPSLNRS